MKNVIEADAAKLAGLQIDTLQKIRNGQITLEHLEWFNKLKKEERDKLSTGTVDPRFSLLTTFQFTVPEDYNHPTQLASFKERDYKKFYYCNDNITDANFTKATNELTPGHTYEAKIFGITKWVTSEDCLAFLKMRNALLVGAQGISIVWQQAKEQFPKGKWTVSFDEKESLWQDADGYRGVPSMYRYSDGGWFFNLYYFGDVWVDDYCVLCLRDPFDFSRHLGVFSCKLFFHPPNIPPISLRRKINEP